MKELLGLPLQEAINRLGGSRNYYVTRYYSYKRDQRSDSERVVNVRRHGDRYELIVCEFKTSI